MKNDEDFQCLLLQTEVCWPLKINCLFQFFFLFDSVLEFFQETDSELCEKLREQKKAFLTDLFAKFKVVNLQLQGDDTNLIKTKSTMSSLLSYLEMCGRNTGRTELTQFPNLILGTEKHEHVSNEDIEIYTNHLKHLHTDMITRFKDLFEFGKPVWMLVPFNAEIGKC